MPSTSPIPQPVRQWFVALTASRFTSTGARLTSSHRGDRERDELPRGAARRAREQPVDDTRIGRARRTGDLVGPSRDDVGPARARGRGRLAHAAPRRVDRRKRPRRRARLSHLHLALPFALTLVLALALSRDSAREHLGARDDAGLDRRRRQLRRRGDGRDVRLGVASGTRRRARCAALPDVGAPSRDPGDHRVRAGSFP